jgi:hypothetical protein
VLWKEKLALILMCIRGNVYRNRETPRIKVGQLNNKEELAQLLSYHDQNTREGKRRLEWNHQKTLTWHILQTHYKEKRR